VQLQLTSLRKRVVSLESWIWQIKVWVIITWDPSNMVPTVLRDTGPPLWHTRPIRHLKVLNSEDTCEVACTAQKGTQFERQPSLPVLVQDTVRAHFVRLLRR
jgi:hypothetical protein